MKITLFVCLFVLRATVSPAAQLVTGTYFTGDGSDGNQASPLGATPPYHLTATNSTFSYVLFYPNQMFTFAQMLSFSATFTSNAGGAGGGAPRLRLLLDADSDNDTGSPCCDNDGNDASISIFLGPSPNYVSNDAVLNSYSGFNVIGNNDAGRYDTSGMPTGGSPFTTYSDALAKYGNLKVLRLGYVIDTFGDFPSRDETLNSLNASINSATPEPGTFGLMTAGLLAAVIAARRRLLNRARVTSPPRSTGS